MYPCWRGVKEGEATGEETKGELPKGGKGWPGGETGTDCKKEGLPKGNGWGDAGMDGPWGIAWGAGVKAGEGKEPIAPGNAPGTKGMAEVCMGAGIVGTAGTSGKVNCVKSGVEGWDATGAFF